MGEEGQVQKEGRDMERVKGERDIWKEGMKEEDGGRKRGWRRGMERGGRERGERDFVIALTN